MIINCPKCNHRFDTTQAEIDETTRKAFERWNKWYDSLTPEQRKDPDIMY